MLDIDNIYQKVHFSHDSNIILDPSAMLPWIQQRKGIY